MTHSAGELSGGLAAVLAHPDDESFGCAGALALAHDAGAPTRLLVATRGEAGIGNGEQGGGSGRGPDEPGSGPDEALADRPDEALADERAALADLREAELICAARKIGLDEVSVLEGYPDGGLADQPFDALVDEIFAWLAARRPAAVITFGPHGVTGHPDHVAVGSATRWAIERLADAGLAPNAVYVISPVFDVGDHRYDLSAEELAPTHRIEVTAVAERTLAALTCHASQADAREQAAALRGAIEAGAPIYEGYVRVRPIVPAPHPKFDTKLL